MVSRRVRKEEESKTRRPPATTPDGREKQLIAMAVDLAEEQLLNGSASAQVISHYLKLGSSRERLEQERLEKENELLEARRAAIQSAARIEELYTTALDAMRTYAGRPQEQGALHEDEDL